MTAAISWAQSPWRVSEKPLGTWVCWGTSVILPPTGSGRPLRYSPRFLAALNVAEQAPLESREAFAKRQCMRWETVIVLEIASDAAELRRLLRE